MAVVRVNKTNNYTVMANYHLKDMNLSLKAKGLMSFMLSLPDTWDYSIAGLAKINKDGIDSVRSALKELEKHGYLTINRIRDEYGKLRDTEYNLTEKPIVENPILEKPILENTTQINTNELNTKELNTNKEIGKKKKTSFIPPSLKEVQSYIQDNCYNVDADSFINFYESKGWYVGKNKMKSWQAAVRTWNSKNKSNDTVKKSQWQVDDERRKQLALSIKQKRLGGNLLI